MIKFLYEMLTNLQYEGKKKSFVWDNWLIFMRYVKQSTMWGKKGIKRENYDQIFIWNVNQSTIWEKKSFVWDNWLIFYTNNVNQSQMWGEKRKDEEHYLNIFFAFL